MVMRDRFDHLLTKAAVAAGAELFAGRTLRAIELRPDGVRLGVDGGQIFSRDGAESTPLRRRSEAGISVRCSTNWAPPL